MTVYCGHDYKKLNIFAWCEGTFCLVNARLKTKLFQKVENASLKSWLNITKEDTQHVVMFLGHSLQAKDLQSSTLTYDAFK